MFENRTILIATKHKKEEVVAPMFKKEFNLNSRVVTNFDTDSLGTFSGEIKRLEDPLTTLRKKCLMSMEMEGADIAVASEGSFGPHPFYYFSPIDNELVIFIDKLNGIEIVASETSMNTNFSGRNVESFSDVLKFATDVKFPSHGIVLRKDPNSNDDIFKGIVTYNDLKKAYDFLSLKYNSVYAETDMRAMYNPSRMLVIEKAFEKLVSKIKSHCPKCDVIGFDVEDVKYGLPCARCGYKTKSVLSHHYLCKHCGYSEDKLFPNNIITEDPMYCDMCNP